MMNLTSSLMLNTILYVVQQEVVTDITPLADPNDLETTRCFGVYGCFSILAPFKSENRPVSPFPASPEELAVRYPTFTRYNVKLPYILDPNQPEKIKSTRFNANGPFFFIAHGYLEGGSKLWIQQMAEALLSLQENINATVIAIDWRRASGPPYSQAVANIRLLGVMTAHMIYDLVIQLNLKNADNFHLIGHSLGAHLCGYTGESLFKEFGMKVGRITGLDPADPFFANVEVNVRLDRSDAKFVDIIHSDAAPFISGGLGITENIGHIDFYPNGGSNQPGCSNGMIQYFNTKNASLADSIRLVIGCNHVRSHEFFRESITTQCPFLSITCPSYQDFTQGRCFECGINNQHCVRFGYHSAKGYNRLIKSHPDLKDVSLTSYFLTGDGSPFCRTHYRVTVNMSSSVESASHGGDVGRLWVVLINRNGTHSERIPLEEQAGYHKPGIQWTTIVSSSNIGVPAMAKIECEYEANIFNPFTWRIIMSPKIYIAWVHIESLEHKKSVTVCSQDESPVIANTPTDFWPQNCKNIGPIKVST